MNKELYDIIASALSLREFEADKAIEIYKRLHAEGEKKNNVLQDQVYRLEAKLASMRDDKNALLINKKTTIHKNELLEKAANRKDNKIATLEGKKSEISSDHDKLIKVGRKRASYIFAGLLLATCLSALIARFPDHLFLFGGFVPITILFVKNIGDFFWD